MADLPEHQDAAPAGNGEDRIEVSLEIMHDLLCALGDAWSEIDRLRKLVRSRGGTLKHLPHPPAAPAATAPRPAAALNDGVIIIDDSKLMQKSLTRMITSLGFDVIGCADNGEIGAEMVIRRNPKLIILDHFMPVMDGLACLRAIRLQCPDVRVIVCTGEATEKLSQGYVRLDVSAIISKPIQIDRFARAVRECMSYDPELLNNLLQDL